MRAYRHASHGGSSGGSSGGGSSGGSSGGSYAGGSYGGGSYGSYGGYSSPAAYTSGYSTGYSSVSGMSSSMPVESYRVIDAAPSASGVSGGEVIATPQPAATDSTMTIPADAAMLVVELPADAKVFVNGSKTAATGSVRRFLSRGLAEGKTYEYVVRMVVDRDGVASEETKVVSLSAGSRKSVAFAGEAVARKAVAKTSLTLHVPADAKVWLAGNETSSRGATRLFETSSLHDGQTWSNYEIRVATVVDGREQIVSKTIDLVAGSVVELELGTDGELTAVTRTAPTESTASIR